MPQWKTISQRNWLKGLQATFGLFSQPSGILTRLSNLVYDKRGSLRTTDGSLVFTRRNGVIQPGDGPIAEFSLYSPPTVNAYYVGIQKGFLQQQSPPSGVTVSQVKVGGTISGIVRSNGVVTLTISGGHNLAAISALTGLPFSPGNLVVAGVTDASFDAVVPYNQIAIVNTNSINFVQNGPNASSSGGTLGTQLAPGTYSYDVTACDGAGGETPATGTPGTLTLTSPNNAVIITWTAGALDVNYSVYGTAAARRGRLNPGPGAIQSINGTTYVDIGLLSIAGQFPPSTNTTQTCAVWRMDVPSYTVQLATLPPYLLPIIGGIGGASGGGSSSGTLSAGAGPSAVGGVPGSLSPLPQITQFTGRLVFALGNGYRPEQYTDPSIDSTGFAPIGNTFTAQYPNWQPSVAWNQGDQIHDATSGGLFTATQGGISGSASPTFNNVVGAVTADNTVAWTCTATSFTGTQLRGAAHAQVYAGSLWLANTWPTTTSDQLDGPNCIKMCDVNNLQSWNPINIAFIAKDDGDQIMGLATFTIAESGISPTGSLVVFKNFSTYQVTGVFGASDFSIQQAQTDLGCIAPRSIQFSPGYGIMRFTHLGIAYFNGVGDKLVSEEIRPYLFGGVSDIQPVDWNYIYFAKGAQSANPPMYMVAVPILANTVAGITIAARIPPAAGADITMYARVSQLALINGAWVETNITPEQAIQCGDESVLVNTPANTSASINYRIYLGLAPGSENRYVQASSFTNFGAIYAGMTPGAPSIGNGSLQRLICYDLVQKTWAIIDMPFEISAIKQVRAPGTIPLTVAGGFADGEMRRLFAGDTTWDTGDAVQWKLTTAEVFQEGGSGKVFYRRITIRGQETLNASIKVQVTIGGKTPPAVTAQQDNLGTNQWMFRVDIMQDGYNANVTASGAGPISIDSIDWQVKPKPAGAPPSIQK
jgi:hypothetical protein